jgi:maleate isomerase
MGKPQERVLGVVYPFDVDIDDDLSKFLPESVSLVSSPTCGVTERATVKYLTSKAEDAEIEESAVQLLNLLPDCLAYTDTSISFVRGVGFDREISKRIKARTGVVATTTSTAMVRALFHLGIKRVAAAAPYLAEVNESLVRFLADSGFSVVKMAGLDLATAEEMVGLSQDEISRLARRADVEEAQAVFVSCTALKTADVIEGLEEDLGKPVLTANQVTMWDALRMMGVSKFPGGVGRLFSYA